MTNDTINLIAGFFIGISIGAIAILSISYSKHQIRPLLIKEQCGHYDEKTGEFVIQNLRSK